MAIKARVTKNNRAEANSARNFEGGKRVFRAQFYFPAVCFGITDYGLEGKLTSRSQSFETN